MAKKIVQIGDPILEQKCDKVDPKDPKIQKLIDELIDACKEKEDITAGLSAPQVGEKLRICICRRTDLEEKSQDPLPAEILWEVLINPTVKSSSKKTSTYWEGCLSIGEGPEGLYGPVARPEEVEVEFQTRTGAKKTLLCNGFFSHVVQHELDHLEGVLFLKYISDPDTIWKGKELDKYYSKHQEYPPV